MHLFLLILGWIIGDSLLRLTLWRTHLYKPQNENKKVFCMLFGYNKNFLPDSGQIKCLAFRSFNEKINVLNECDERNSLTPVLFKGSESTARRKRYNPNFSVFPKNPNPTKAQGKPRPSRLKRAPSKKKVL